LGGSSKEIARGTDRLDAGSELPKEKVKVMGTILIIVVLVLLLGGGGGYYGYNRYGNRGLGGAVGLLLVILVVVWLFGGFGGMHHFS
jgi:hypothetical protein